MRFFQGASGHLDEHKLAIDGAIVPSPASRCEMGRIAPLKITDTLVI